jgi:hypothetical protein
VAAVVVGGQIIQALRVAQAAQLLTTAAAAAVAVRRQLPASAATVRKVV